MELLNRDLRIYGFDPAELSLGQIRSYFSDNEDAVKLCDFGVVYDQETDEFLVNQQSVNYLHNLDFCIRGLSKGTTAMQNIIQRLNCENNRGLARVVLRALVERDKITESIDCNNPNSKFVSVGDDIFQISKIVSVRSRNEGHRAFIELFIANRRASVKKEFISISKRDSEFMKIKSVLAQAA